MAPQAEKCINLNNLVCFGLSKTQQHILLIFSKCSRLVKVKKLTGTKQKRTTLKIQISWKLSMIRLFSVAQILVRQILRPAQTSSDSPGILNF